MIKFSSHYKYIRWCHTALESIESKIYKPDKVKTKKMLPENIFHVTFSPKVVDITNLPFIINSLNVKSIFVTTGYSFILTWLLMI